MILPEDEEFLAHFGVKGMRWGVRSNRTPGVKKRTDKKAKADAEEYINAKGIVIKSKKKRFSTTVYGPSVKRYDTGPRAAQMKNIKVATKKGVDPKGKYGDKYAKKNLKKITRSVQKKRRKDIAYDAAFINHAQTAADSFVRSPTGTRIMKMQMSKIYRRSPRKAENRLAEQLLEGLGDVR